MNTAVRKAVVDQLYVAAVDADERFATELTRVYGAEGRSRQRYWPRERHNDVPLLVALFTWEATSQAYNAACDCEAGEV